ncbi:MAG: alpha-amylase [Gemmatimonadaceae bacterium]
MSHRPLSFAACLLVLGLLTATGCGPDSAPTEPLIQPPVRPSLPRIYRPSGHAEAGEVFVHLFEWKWTDIATECEGVLAAAGFTAVQVSPPQEHSVEPTHTWSQRYQPVSYSIARSRSGTGVEFVDMVNRCKAVGVGIYVDAVINHMTNYPSPGIGSNGTSYTKYSYPPLYTPGDFHTPCTIENYQDAANVQDCQLFSLPDLNTGLPSVRRKIAGYLIMLARLGVAGFRIDAAKHIQQVELDNILNVVNSTMIADGRPIPYYFLEVAGGGAEALSARDYFGAAYSSGGTADITEFTFAGAGNKFLGVNAEHISQLNPSGQPGNQFSEQAWGLMPSDKAIVFLQNHDTQHSGGISYRDSSMFRLANVWMLAQPYGYPSILSSYAFSYPSGNSMGPPSDASGNTSDVRCASNLEAATIGQWVCEHRDAAVASMVRFRRTVAGADINHWWDDGANAIAFSRGDKGFVAINRESAPVDATIGTGLAPGTYCDLLTGGRSGAECTGTSVVVGPLGTVTLTLPPNMAIAIDVDTKL